MACVGCVSVRVCELQFEQLCQLSTNTVTTIFIRECLVVEIFPNYRRKFVCVSPDHSEPKVSVERLKNL